MSQGVSLAVAAVLGGFGQFGLSESCSLQTIDLTPKSFRVQTKGAVEISFSEGATGRGSPNLSRYVRSLTLSPEPRSPLRVLYETTSLGFSLEYRDGFRFSGSGVGAPFLTWSEGSVGAGVPTPPVRWVIVSWPTSQPPLLLCFDPGEATVAARSVENGFVIETVRPFAGRVRVRTPMGTSNVATKGAADLGRLLQSARPFVSMHEVSAPRPRGFHVAREGKALVGTWVFDKPGAIIPKTIQAAAEVGALRIVSDVSKADASAKPRLACAGSELKIKLFAVGVRPGSALLSSPAVRENLPATISHLDGRSLAESAFGFLSGTADTITLRAIVEAISAFEDSHRNAPVEPSSGVRMLFGPNGQGAAGTAAFALAELAIGRTSKGFDGLFGSVDWVNLYPAGATHEERRDAAALLSVACALRPSHEEQFFGGLINASLAAQRESGHAPYHALRSWLFPSIALSGTRKPDWVQPLISVLGLTEDSFGKLTYRVAGNEVVIEGNARNLIPQSFQLVSQKPLLVRGYAGLKACRLEMDGDRANFEITPSVVGVWRIRLGLKGAALNLPKSFPSPSYSAARR